MSQQINLYRPIFRRQEKKFSAVAMVQAGVATLIGAALIYGAMRWQLHEMRSTLERATQQQVAASARLQDTAQRLGKRVTKESEADVVTRLEREVEALRQAQQALSRDLRVKRGGYSEYFVALARLHVTGLWLTGVSISEAGDNLVLAGRTVDAVNVPRYVQRLSAEPVLAGKEFEVFVISGEKSQPTLEFSLKTTAPERELGKGARRS